MPKIVAVGFLALALALAAGSPSAFAQAPAGNRAAPASATLGDGMVTVFTARKIVTMDPGWPEATAVAVKDGKILSVGTLEDLKPWLDRYPHKIDKQFESRVIYPGFVEAHSHPVIGATSLTRPPLSYFPTPNPYGPAFPGVKTRQAALAKLAEYVAASKEPNADVLAFGFDVVPMGGYLDKTELDRISTEKPIFVWDASEHFVFANTAAMKKRGITKNIATKFPGVGLGPDGELNGQFLGESITQHVLSPTIGELLTPQAAVKNARFLSDLAQQAGVTTRSELAFGMVEIPVEREVL
jgi:predicted amidohydrolase YtcJ